MSVLGDLRRSFPVRVSTMCSPGLLRRSCLRRSIPPGGPTASSCAESTLAPRWSLAYALTALVLDGRLGAFSD